MKWFRFYHEALDDPKVQLLSDRRYRHWVNLLCLANQGTPRGSLPNQAGIAFRLRLSMDEASDMLAEFVAAELLETDDAGQWWPHNWNGRQRSSDDVAVRVADHRERTASSIESNVTDSVSVTPVKRSSRAHSEAETEADTETDTEPEDDAAAARASDVELSPAERQVIGYIRQVPGMAAVGDAEIVAHLRDVLSVHDPPPSQKSVLADAIRFRDNWAEKRSTAPDDERWRGWRQGITNWFSRTKDVPITRIAARSNTQEQRRETNLTNILNAANKSQLPKASNQ